MQTILSLWRTKQGYCIARSVPPILFSTLALSLPTRPSPSRACVTRGSRSTCGNPKCSSTTNLQTKCVCRMRLHLMFANALRWNATFLSNREGGWVPHDLCGFAYPPPSPSPPAVYFACCFQLQLICSCERVCNIIVLFKCLKSF